MKIGDQMPSFAVKDQDGRTVKSDELIGRGRKIVLTPIRRIPLRDARQRPAVSVTAMRT